MKTNKNYKRYLRLRYKLSNIALIAAGVMLAAFGLKGFLIPNHFIDGGVVGLSLLATDLTDIPVSIWLIVLNGPFIFLGITQIGKKFAITTLLAIIALSAIIYFIDFPVITDDKLLISIFGGFFIGSGIGLAMRGGCVLDGTEIIAVFLNRKSVLSIGDIILLINVFIFGVAAFILGRETAMYSILTYLSAAKTVDFIIQGIEEYTGVTIISVKSNKIREAIINTMRRGVTIYKGEQGFGTTGHRKEMDIVFTVVTRLEVSKLKEEVLSIDRKAFMVFNVITDTKGGIVKPRPLH